MSLEPRVVRDTPVLRHAQKYVEEKTYEEHQATYSGEEDGGVAHRTLAGHGVLCNERPVWLTCEHINNQEDSKG